MVLLFKLISLYFLTQAVTSVNYIVQNAANGWDQTCASGMEQSPINLTGSIPHTNAELFIYPANLKIVQTSASTDFLWKFQIKSGARSFLKYRLKSKPAGANDCQEATYTAIEFHFHRDSQHSINGNLATIELHIVHQRDPQFGHCSNLRGYSVLGVLFNEDPNAANNQFFEEIGIGKNPIKGEVDLEQYLGNWFDQGVYNYKGSLTTPKCLQVVNWLVSTEVQTISTAQRQVFEGMGTLANSYKSNRMVQNINSRTLYTINKGDVEVVGSGVSSIESSDSDDWKIIVGIMVPLFVIIIVLLILLLVCFLKGKNQNDSKKQAYSSALDKSQSADANNKV